MGKGKFRPPPTHSSGIYWYLLIGLCNFCNKIFKIFRSKGFKILRFLLICWSSLKVITVLLAQPAMNKKAVLSQGPRDAACFSHAQWLFDCYLLQLTKGQGRYSSGYSTGSHLSTKSRLNVKLKITTPWPTCFETWCIMTFQGHPRSLILVPFENHRTSYWTSIVTLVLSCRVSEILELLYAKSRFFDTPPLLWPKFQGFPSE